MVKLFLIWITSKIFTRKKFCENFISSYVNVKLKSLKLLLLYIIYVEDSHSLIYLSISSERFFWKLNISYVIKIWLRITLQLIISLDFKPLSLVQHLYNCIAQVRPLTTSLHRTRKKHLNFNVYFLMFSSLILISNICNSNY